MEKMPRITGNLINAFIICKRKAWLYAYEITPFGDNYYLEMGTLIGKETYKREKKEIALPGMKIDIIRKDKGKVLIAEVKKSSKGKKAAYMQILFYLYNLEKRGIRTKGELLIPKEKRREEIRLNEKNKKALQKIILEIDNLIKKDIPPLAIKSVYCKKCAFNEFCWAEIDE